MTRYISSLLFLALLPLNVHAWLYNDFNWMPACSVDVGDYKSEAAMQYDATNGSKPVTVPVLLPSGGTDVITGRWIEVAESFTIKPARWRGGNVMADIVLARTVAPTGEAANVTVCIGTHTAGVWRVTPPTDGKTIVSYFAIPSNVWHSAVEKPEKTSVTLLNDTPVFSSGYSVYSTRDWQILPKEAAYDIAATYTQADGAAREYLKGLIEAGKQNWETAFSAFETAADNAAKEGAEEIARLARRGYRRTRVTAASANSAENSAEDTFETHYSLGMYAASVGAWDVALKEFNRAVELEPTHADATYHLAEAMEYNGMPISQCAAVFERSGILATGPDCNEINVLAAIHASAVSGMCSRLTLEALNAIKSDWQNVEKMVFGASRGAYKLNTDFYVRGSNDPEWVMQAGWIFLPPDSVVPVEGTYDYSIGFANYPSSHAGGPDCGVSGAGGSQIGAFRSWEVFLHEWNHQFDWVCVFPESIPIYPTTHDSDGCGKQPIRSMGCGHRSSMYYYIPREDYLRHEAADPVNSDAALQLWDILSPVAPEQPPSMEMKELISWLTGSQGFTAEDVNRVTQNWANQVKEHTKLRAVPAYKTYPVPPSAEAALVKEWQLENILESETPEENDFIRGKDVSIAAIEVTQTGDFLNLLDVYPDASGKCYALARTFIYSPCTQEVRLWFGVNDRIAAWLNTKRLLSGTYLSCAKWDDANRPYMIAHAGQLLPGWNSLAIKTQRAGGDWGFSVHMTDRENNTIENTKIAQKLPKNAVANMYTPPAVGSLYSWSDVEEDYRELLPLLSADDIAKITGIDGLTISDTVFFIELPEGTQPLEGSRYIATADEEDREFNNYLNYDYEPAAAVRYTRAGETRDLLFVRPEYIEEYLALVESSDNGTAPEDSLLGYVFIPHVSYRSTPNHTGRAVFVIDTQLDIYPVDNEDILELP